MNGETVTAWCVSEGSGEFRGTVARLEDASDAARGVSRQDERVDSMAPIGGADRADPSQTGARSPTVPAWGGAARARRAGVLQPQSPRHGGPDLGDGVGEALGGATPVACTARRDDGPELPPPVGAGRRRLSGRRQARGEPGRRGGRAGRDEGRKASAAEQGGSAGGHGEARGAGAGEGRTSVPAREAPLRLREGVHPARIP